MLIPRKAKQSIGVNARGRVPFRGTTAASQSWPAGSQLRLHLTINAPTRETDRRRLAA
jgi:hypothetical protein